MRGRRRRLGGGRRYVRRSGWNVRGSGRALAWGWLDGLRRGRSCCRLPPGHLTCGACDRFSFGARALGLRAPNCCELRASFAGCITRVSGDPGFRLRDDFVVLLGIFEEVRNIQKGVPIETHIYERGLHARKHTADAAFINAACQPDAGIPFVVHLNQFVVFEHGDLRLVRRRGNEQLL